MKQIISLFLCMFYTFISFGGTIYVHECSGGTSLSIYEKASHKSCPLCSKDPHHHQQEKKSCSAGKCKDIEIQIDQISDKAVNQASNFFHITSPAVITKHWIILKPTVIALVHQPFASVQKTIYADSSPPPFILHCTFRL